MSHDDQQPATTAGACDDETVIVPPPTTATPDLAFLQALQRDEIAAPNQTKALVAAHWVCSEFRGGYTRADVVTILKKSNPEITELGAADFMAAAIAFYCPQYA